MLEPRQEPGLCERRRRLRDEGERKLGLGGDRKQIRIAVRLVQDPQYRVLEFGRVAPAGIAEEPAWPETRLAFRRKVEIARIPLNDGDDGFERSEGIAERLRRLKIEIIRGGVVLGV